MKKNGFIFIETVVVVSAISLTLIILFASYSYILSKAKEKNNFDTTETIYKTYYTKLIMQENSTYKTVLNFLQSHSAQCKSLGLSGYSGYNYVCDLGGTTNPGDLYAVKHAFEVDKIYYVNPSTIVSSSRKKEWLNKFDATTIDYILSIGKTKNYDTLIVKFKKTYQQPNEFLFETLHGSIRG